MIFICQLVCFDQKQQELATIAQLQIQYNQLLDNATEAAMNQLIEVDNGKERIFDLNEVVETFFRDLAICFGKGEHKAFQEKMKQYVPVIAFALEDGVQFYYQTVDQTGKLVAKWSTCFPYIYEDGTFLYAVTMTENLKILNQEKQVIAEGNYHDLAKQYAATFLQSEKKYDQIRRRTIVDQIIKQLTAYINRYNRVGKQLGIQYHFALPVIPKESWYNTVDHISIFVFLQGYPYPCSGTMTYQKYCFAGAKIEKTERTEE